MIAFFVRRPPHAQAIARHFTSATREVDGPYRLHKGRLRGKLASCFVVTEGIESAWAATRLAIRRGAHSIVPITSAYSEPDIAEEAGFALGDLIPVGECWNLSGLLPFLRLLPDSAVRLPLEIATLYPSAPSLASDDPALPAMGTLPFLVENGGLLRYLHRHHGLSLFDLQLCGYAEGMADSGESLHIRPLALLQGLAGDGSMEYASKILLDETFERAMDTLLSDPHQPGASEAG